MTFSHALGTNNYGPAKFIVDASAANGTHTTIASALTSASSGDTIFIRPGTYTENLTLKAGVNLVAFTGDSSLNKLVTQFNVTIVGKATATFAGSCSISNICLQTNSDFVLVVSGSNATYIDLNNCFINATNNTALSLTSNGGSVVQFINCYGSLGTTGIAYFVATSGFISMFGGQYANQGSSTTASTLSNATIEMNFSAFLSTITTTNASGINLKQAYIGVGNTTAITLAGTSALTADLSIIASGSASAVSVGSGCTATIFNSELSSSNTNVLTGSGTLTYGGNSFTNSSSGVNVSSLSPVALTVPQGGTGLTAPGTSGNVLTSNGTVWTSTAPSSGKLVFIQSKTASNSATLDFTSAPITSYSALLVIVQAIIPATNSTDFQMLQSTDGGSTWLGAGQYAGGLNYNEYNTATLSNTNSSALFPLGHVLLNTQTITGFLYIINFAQSSALQISGQMVWNDTTRITIGIPMGQGSTGVNGLRFQMASGNITSGYIVVYGLAPS